MLESIWTFILSLLMATVLVLQIGLPEALAQQILPHPEKPFTGKIGLTYPSFVRLGELE